MGVISYEIEQTRKDSDSSTFRFINGDSEGTLRFSSEAFSFDGRWDIDINNLKASVFFKDKLSRKGEKLLRPYLITQDDEEVGIISEVSDKKFGFLVTNEYVRLTLGIQEYEIYITEPESCRTIIFKDSVQVGEIIRIKSNPSGYNTYRLYVESKFTSPIIFCFCYVYILNDYVAGGGTHREYRKLKKIDPSILANIDNNFKSKVEI